MKDRIKQLRKTLKLNQDEFGAKIGAKQSTITAYECGYRTPMDTTINAICREFNVNETWLRTGDGEMFQPHSLGEEIGILVRDASTVNPEEAAAYFHSMIDELDPAEIMLIYQIFRRHFPK